ncbi:HpcH/HpaI aldolase/citrate lyase family protein [Cupriavidus neocaledonicus]|uniref:Citrate lyase beta subunit n=1 Tax=Cupriavidus neocaledonicus TaxID=1040979 RepID=A0A375H3A2_9BURK|nr:aldolase/citrate lyase family protein [Cupriavidus neocaledonicus]SOZ37178.1 Citrate lyase beta subunit [Cupriavidus neocaledonicus]SPD45755.1 Host specificity protein [Cupriavidus neocaledonicus]
MKPPVTYLFVPGNRPERFDKAVRAMPDAVILDLEDAVHPAAKEAARAAVARWHAATPAGGARRHIRINAASTAEFEATWRGCWRCRRPGAATPSCCPRRKRRSRSLNWRNGCTAGSPMPNLWRSSRPLAGWPMSRQLRRCPAVSRLASGSLDFSLDLGCEEAPEAFLHARSRIVLASRLASLPAPVDGITPDFARLDAVRADAAHARRLGFGAKLCIHPVQVSPVREIFAPDALRLDWAQRVLVAAQDNHAVQVDGKMVDLPLIEQAQRVLLAQSTDRKPAAT